MKETDPLLGKMMLQVVEKQIRDLDPPETKQTYERLLAEGNSPKEAKRLIACVVSTEIWEILHNQEEYDQTRFVAALERLPKMPWDE